MTDEFETSPARQPTVSKSADEALLYAREHWATISEEDGFPEVAEAYRRGVNDEVLATDALFYRAGSAASAERIKELEARVAELEVALKPLAQCEIPGEIPSLPDDQGCRYYFTFGEIRTARALLNEPRNGTTSTPAPCVTDRSVGD